MLRFPHPPPAPLATARSPRSYLSSYYPDCAPKYRSSGPLLYSAHVGGRLGNISYPSARREERMAEET